MENSNHTNLTPWYGKTRLTYLNQEQEVKPIHRKLSTKGLDCNRSMWDTCFSIYENLPKISTDQEIHSSYPRQWLPPPEEDILLLWQEWMR